MNKKRLLDYDEELIKDLQDPELAYHYLNEALMDEDPALFFLAVKNVLEAQGKSISHLAQDTNLNRENLYRMLSKRGNPVFINLKSVLHTMGFDFNIQPRKHK